MSARLTSRSMLAVSAVLTVTAAAMAAPTVSARAPQSRREKSVLVTVLDKSGAAVTGLSAADFSVREDGVARDVLSVTAETEPLFVTVILDDSLPPPGADAGISDVRGALTSFVTTVQHASPTAAISLMDCAGAAVVTQDFTTVTGTLTQKTERLFPSLQGGAVLLEALVEASKNLAAKPSPRRDVVSINFDSPESSEILSKAVTAAFQKSGATLWAVSLTRTGSASALPNSGEADRNREDTLRRLPPATGGQRAIVIGTASLESTLTRMAHNLTSQYELTYTRPDSVASVSVITPAAAHGDTVLMSQWVR